MINFIVGIVIGIVVATVGFGTLAYHLERGVEFIEKTTEEDMKE